MTLIAKFMDNERKRKSGSQGWFSVRVVYCEKIIINIAQEMNELIKLWQGRWFWKASSRQLKKIGNLNIKNG